MWSEPVKSVPVAFRKLGTTIIQSLRLSDATKIRDVDDVFTQAIYQFEAYVFSEHLWDGTVVVRGTVETSVPQTWVDHLMAEHGHRWWIRLVLNRPAGTINLTTLSLPYVRTVEYSRDALFPEADVVVPTDRFGRVTIEETHHIF